jgi:hypothetical protein
MCSLLCRSEEAFWADKMSLKKWRAFAMSSLERQAKTKGIKMHDEDCKEGDIFHYVS